MRNDAQGFPGSLCHFSFACWFKKMPQITETRKNNAISLVHTFFKVNGVLKRCLMHLTLFYTIGASY